MKTLVVFCLAILLQPEAEAQGVTGAAEQQLERLAERPGNGAAAEDYLDDLRRLHRRPLAINSASAEDWQVFRVLTALQIQSLMRYREALGDLVSVYELQAVPGWDVATVRQLLPYLVLTDGASALRRRLRAGDHEIIVRETRHWDDAGGESMEKGSPDHLLVRYRYQFKNLLRYGLTAEKDAGEPFGKGGFDFYSAHVFARHIGHIEAVALGDFTVNLGQGLVQWQGLAFKKSGDIVAIKRQGPVLQPYGSSGETGFERGVGATLQQGRFQATAYWSRLKRDGNVVADSVGSGWVSSLPASGLHRSAAERADRKAVIQTDAGANLRLLLKGGQVGLTVVAGRLSKALKPGPEPYHRFDLQGRQWLNAGVDYSYTIANMHVFGEAAFNRDGDGAVVSGLLLSVDPRLDVAFLGRRIGVRYRAMSGDAFTESVTPGNESGAYVGVAVRPSAAWRVEGYVDVYASKGLRFRVNGPSRGTDCLLQATHTPLRGTELYLRYRVERKDGNGDGPAPVPAVVPHLRQTIRLQAVCPLSPVVTLKCRTELAWYDKRSAGGEAGFLGFAEAAVKPPGKFSGNARLQYFETGGYESRLYTYESDVPGGALIPAFSGKGFRYYVNFGVDLTRKLGVDLRFARTVFNEGRGAEIIGGEGVAARRTEAKIQAHYTFQGF